MKGKIIRVLIVTCLVFINTYSYVAELVNASWSAGSSTINATTTYTFTYQAVTANPYYVFYTQFPVSFSCAGVADVTVTVDGTPATIATGVSSVGGTNVYISLATTNLVAAGSSIVVTALVTNASGAGPKIWSYIRTANSAFVKLDEISSPTAITLTSPVPGAGIATAATTITTTGFKAFYSPIMHATTYLLDVS